MMITKLRGLGLGLFPAEKDVASTSESTEEVPADGWPAEEWPAEEMPAEELPADEISADENPAGEVPLPADHGLVVERADDCHPAPGSSRRSDASYGSKSVEPSFNACSISGRRKSYGLALFEAEVASFKAAQRKKQVPHEEHVSGRIDNEEPFHEVPIRREDPEELMVRRGEPCFVDEDGIKLVKKLNAFDGLGRNVYVESFLLVIPKRVMTRMPRSPDSSDSVPSNPHFFIKVLMVQLEDSPSVNAAVDWLVDDGQSPTGHIVGLDCRLDSNMSLTLLQLSLHRRCILIRLTPATDQSAPPNRARNPRKLIELLKSTDVVKTGTNMEHAALAIYVATGMIVNGCKSIEEVYTYKERPSSLKTIFRKLYQWSWTMNQEIIASDWGRLELSSKQIKFGILSVWSSRMIALDGVARESEDAVTSISLNNYPGLMLDLFGRTLAAAFQEDDSLCHETTGTLSETSSPGTLQLLQNSFRSRLKGKCTVEIHRKEEQGSVQFKVQSRQGKTVTLAPMQPTPRYRKNERPASDCAGELANEVTIDMISGLTVLESAKVVKWRIDRIREGLRRIIRHPAECPKHLRLAFGFRKLQLELPVKNSHLRSAELKAISSHLNESQREAWECVLTSSLSATIGPPGTGKTSLIAAIAKSWIAAKSADSQEVLVCTAYQNVAVRHLAETLAEDEVQGVLLFISEDYYRGWHEGFYTRLADALVTSSADQCELSINLAAWRTRNGDMSFPKVIVCTVDLVGSNPFLSCLMIGKVTALIVDESSQASDVSLVRLLLDLPDLAMVSVLGDPHQLPPYAASRNTTTDHNVASVFDLVSRGCSVNFLSEQYRMPPSICDFLSAEVYDAQLRTSAHRAKEKDTTPLVWAHVKGSSTCAPGKTSMYNAVEANAVVRFCKSLVATSGMALCQRMVILTLYEEQNRKISEELAGNEINIPVHNVDSFQGQQCDIVLISLVVGRSFSQFAADQRRACVMLSRVKRLLCVFGDSEEVKRNPQAGLWAKLAHHCKKRALVVDEDKADHFLLPVFEEMKETWGVIQEMSFSKIELQAAADDKPPAAVAVQVLFRAR